MRSDRSDRSDISDISDISESKGLRLSYNKICHLDPIFF